LTFWITVPQGMLLLIQGITGVCIYLTGCYIMKFSAFFQLITLFKKVFLKK